MERSESLLSRSLLWLMMALAVVCLTQSVTMAQENLPGPLDEVGIDQNLGDQVSLDLEFRDEMGRKVRLGDYFGERPVILALVYYECPMLCTLVLNGLTGAMGVLPIDVGTDFEVVAVSIDPGESFPLAMAKKKEYLKRLGRKGAEGGMHFLTGNEEEIKALTAAVGFRYSYDAETDLYAHAAGIMVLTPSGKLARYLYGVEYPARDLRLALVEASEGRIGSLADQVLLFCFQYDPSTGKYSAAIWNIMRAGGIITILIISGFMFRMFRKERVQP